MIIIRITFISLKMPTRDNFLFAAFAAEFYFLFYFNFLNISYFYAIFMTLSCQCQRIIV